MNHSFTDVDDDIEFCEVCDCIHETRDCNWTLCGRCYEMLDNCNCINPPEISVEEWLNLGSPPPTGKRKIK